VQARLRSLEQLMPFTTAGELIAAKRQPLVSVGPGATARAALRVMEEKDIGFLPVLDGEKLVGVVSERDIASGVIKAATPHSTAVLMNRISRFVFISNLLLSVVLSSKSV
jgi:CBS domain-containing protein